MFMLESGFNFEDMLVIGLIKAQKEKSSLNSFVFPVTRNTAKS